MHAYMSMYIDVLNSPIQLQSNHELYIAENKRYVITDDRLSQSVQTAYELLTRD